MAGKINWRKRKKFSKKISTLQQRLKCLAFYYAAEGTGVEPVSPYGH